jgi:hypothetical protein
MGGSSWRGTVGFVAAGLELAEQVAAGEIPRPDRIYVGTGTMGTAVGIALGLAIAEFDTEVHAVRASVTEITNEHLMQNLADKTVMMMRTLDDTDKHQTAKQFFRRGLRTFDAGSGRSHCIRERTARYRTGIDLHRQSDGSAARGLAGTGKRGTQYAFLEYLLRDAGNGTDGSPAGRAIVTGRISKVFRVSRPGY